MPPSIHEVDRKPLAAGEHVELATEGTGHRIYVTAVEGQTVVVVGNGEGDRSSISLNNEG